MWNIFCGTPCFPTIIPCKESYMPRVVILQPGAFFMDSRYFIVCRAGSCSYRIHRRCHPEQSRRTFPAANNWHAEDSSTTPQAAPLRMTHYWQIVNMLNDNLRYCAYNLSLWERCQPEQADGEGVVHFIALSVKNQRFLPALPEGERVIR